ncbi:MAG: hypothetical protein PHQ40_20530 [Anaerolineaceae bacterium]|nr:hypothetical protein [Anaerolineaceae bacterium]
MSWGVEMDETQMALIAEQMKHAHSLLRSDLEALHSDMKHYRELTNLRLGDLEAVQRDHEARLRSASDGITQFKVYTGLANAGASLLALLALLKAYILGG